MRVWRFGFGILTAVLLLCSGQAQAKEETMGKAAVGDITVDIFADAYRDLDAGLFLPADDGQAAAVKQAYPEGKTRNSLNVFLIRAGKRLILVDTGGGTLIGPGAGNLPGLMRQAGVKPEDITDVVLTHVHRDHIGGLAADGRAAFPKAVVRLSRAERDFWTSAEHEAKAPERAKSTFAATRDMLALYPGKVEVFEPGQEIAPGVSILEAYGHTPGHVALLVKSKGAGLLLFGDLLHALALQTARPDVAIAFDSDPAKAVASRKALLARAAAEGWLVSGVHVPGPEAYRLTAAGEGFTLVK